MTDSRAASPQPLILVAVGGDATAPTRLPEGLPQGSIVVAADSGLDLLERISVRPDHLVGDLDSASADAIARAVERGAEVHRHAADKDATDLELALDLIVDDLVPASGIERIVVIGGGGGRLDHLLGDLLVLSSPRLAAFEVTAHLGRATITVVRPGPGRFIAGSVGEQVSLLPVHGSADGVSTEGLRWPLVDAHLAMGTTRAMSNELAAQSASVRLAAGVLAVVAPGTMASPIEPRTTPYDPTPTAPRRNI